MPKKPDEIKKGLECCSEDSCKSCPYEQDCYTTDGFSALAADALALIQQLEATVSEKEKVVAELSGKIGQLEAERDTLVDDIRMEGGLCSICKYADNMAHSKPCRDCNELVVSDHSNWQWRGVQKEE